MVCYRKERKEAWSGGGRKGGNGLGRARRKGALLPPTGRHGIDAPGLACLALLARTRGSAGAGWRS